MNDYKFGNFICYLRTEKGFSQSHLGNMLGVSNKAVSKWEMGVSKPRPDMLVTLATLFGVTVEELLAGEKNEETEENKKSGDNTIKLWASEYIKKKKRGLIAAITAGLLPIVLFVWVGIIVSLNSTDTILGPIGMVVVFFAEAIDIALIFVFYGSARRLKRLLYAAYNEQTEEITAIISAKKAKIPMLKWEKVCNVISASIIFLCSVLRLVVHCLIETKNILRNFDIAVIIVMGMACIFELIVLICYLVRAHRINKQK